MPASDRHELYLTDTVWGELKVRALQERKSAGGIISFLLEWAVKNPEAIPALPRYQSRLDPQEFEQRKNRTVRGISEEVWARAVWIAESSTPPFSISGLVENLLRNYLGLRQDEETEPDTASAENDDDQSPGLVRTGRYTFDLGANPAEIDLSSRRPGGEPPGNDPGDQAAQ